MGRYVEAVYKECPRIILQTKDGNDVAHFVSPVASSMVPMPGMMLWGQRFFVWHHNEHDGLILKEVIYREDIVWNLSEFNSEQLEVLKTFLPTVG